MSKMRLQTGSDGGKIFWCLGCDMAHPVAVGNGRGPRWDWNGSVDKPTFRPSVLVRWNEYEKSCVCHSFVTDGSVQYLNDCTHPLAGQTVELPEWDWESV